MWRCRAEDRATAPEPTPCLWPRRSRVRVPSLTLRRRRRICRLFAVSLTDGTSFSHPLRPPATESWGPNWGQRWAPRPGRAAKPRRVTPTRDPAIADGFLSSRRRGTWRSLVATGPTRVATSRAAPGSSHMRGMLHGVHVTSAVEVERVRASLRPARRDTARQCRTRTSRSCVVFWLVTSRATTGRRLKRWTQTSSCGWTRRHSQSPGPFADAML